MKWLVRYCAKSDANANRVMWVGIIGMVLIGFAGR